jgi:hypothetical protein
MRPCVAEAYRNGAQDRLNFEKMRFAIIYELKRLETEKKEIKIFLLEWNKKNYQVLATGEAQRQLCDFVEWFFKHDCKLSCKVLEDYCLFPTGGCGFKPVPYSGEIRLPFSEMDAVNYLLKEYRPHGYLMGVIVRVLFKIQLEKCARHEVFVGLRTLEARINEEYRFHIDLMTILRALNELETAKLIRITHGKPGTFGKRTANGYTFLPWSPPFIEQPIITHVCNKSDIPYCVTSLQVSKSITKKARNEHEPGTKD